MSFLTFFYCKISEKQGSKLKFVKISIPMGIHSQGICTGISYSPPFFLMAYSVSHNAGWWDATFEECQAHNVPTHINGKWQWLCRRTLFLHEYMAKFNIFDVIDNTFSKVFDSSIVFLYPLPLLHNHCSNMAYVSPTTVIIWQDILSLRKYWFTRHD